MRPIRQPAQQPLVHRRLRPASAQRRQIRVCERGFTARRKSVASTMHTRLQGQSAIRQAPGAVFERVGFFAFLGILGKGRPPPDVEMNSRGLSTLRVEGRRNGDG